jgi:hypothetical protein
VTHHSDLLADQDRAPGNRQRRLGRRGTRDRNQEGERQQEEQQAAPRDHRPSIAGPGASVSRRRTGKAKTPLL